MEEGSPRTNLGMPDSRERYGRRNTKNRRNPLLCSSGKMPPAKGRKRIGEAEHAAAIPNAVGFGGVNAAPSAMSFSVMSIPVESRPLSQKCGEVNLMFWLGSIKGNGPCAGRKDAGSVCPQAITEVK